MLQKSLKAQTCPVRTWLGTWQDNPRGRELEYFEMKVGGSSVLLEVWRSWGLEAYCGVEGSSIPDCPRT